MPIEYQMLLTLTVVGLAVGGYVLYLRRKHNRKD